jgi:hypothetical protein
MGYNLPPNKCLKKWFIFLALVILGPKNLKKQINIFLRPLMEELKEMCQGVDAYDSHLKCRFNLRVAYLWSMHDYLEYDSDAFRLQHSRKVSFFGCHRRFLPMSHEFIHYNKYGCL